RCAQASVAAVGPIDAPLARFRVVHAQAQALEMRRRAADFEFPEIGAALPHFSDDGDAVKFNPGVRAGQRMQQASDVRFPGPELEIEVMLAVALLDSFR